MVKELNELAEEIHKGNLKRGFDTNINKQPLATSMMLIVSECSEVVEADRKGRWAGYGMVDNIIADIANDESVDKIKKEFLETCKDTVEDELADVLIRLLDFCGANNIDIASHVTAKLYYNETREYKHGKKY